MFLEEIVNARSKGAAAVTQQQFSIVSKIAAH